MNLFDAAKAMGAGIYAAPIVSAADRYAIDLPRRQGYFLGQMSVESGGFEATIESMNYSVEGLLSTFSRERISHADATRLGRYKGHKAEQQKIANLVYGGVWGKRNLGNTLPNDGWNLRGHGLKQLTGRYNIGAFSRAYYGDERLLTNPSPLVNDPVVAAASAAWFWQWKGCNKFADAGDTRGLTKVVNGGYNGLKERIAETNKALKLLGVA